MVMFIESVHIQYCTKNTATVPNENYSHLVKQWNRRKPHACSNPTQNTYNPPTPQAANTVAMYDQCVALHTQLTCTACLLKLQVTTLYSAFRKVLSVV